MVKRRAVNGEFRYLEPSYQGQVRADVMPNDRLASAHALEAMRWSTTAPLACRWSAGPARQSAPRERR